MRYRWFESISLQRRVWCEPGFGGCFGCLVLISQHPTTRRSADGARHCRCRDHDQAANRSTCWWTAQGSSSSHDRSHAGRSRALGQMRRCRITAGRARVCRSGQTDGGVDIDLPNGRTESSNPAVSLLRTAPAIRKVQFARKLETLEAALSSWREGEGGCRQSDPGSPYLSYPFINFSQ